MDDHKQDFYRKLGHFFPIFAKGHGRPPSPPPSSYAPAKYGSDNYKTLPNLFMRFHIWVIYHWLIYHLSFIIETNIFYSLIRARTWAYEEVRNFSFSENIASVLSE